MDINSSIILDVWESISEYVPNNRREDVANKLIKNFLDAGLEYSDFETIKGEDSYIDAAIDSIREDEDEDEYDFDAEDYDRD